MIFVKDYAESTTFR